MLEVLQAWGDAPMGLWESHKFHILLEQGDIQLSILWIPIFALHLSVEYLRNEIIPAEMWKIPAVVVLVHIDIRQCLGNKSLTIKACVINSNPNPCAMISHCSRAHIRSSTVGWSFSYNMIQSTVMDDISLGETLFPGSASCTWLWPQILHCYRLQFNGWPWWLQMWQNCGWSEWTLIQSTDVNES